MPSKRQTARRLCYEELLPSDGKAFATLYAIYADLFPLPDEREPPEAFYEIAALNEHADIQRRFGPWREIVAAIRLWQGGPLIGGHVFGLTTSPAHEDFGCLASVQAIYTFVERRARGQLDIADVKAYMTNAALAKFGFDPAAARPAPLIFSEVNNPLNMTQDEIEKDRSHSGIDPFRRYSLWKSVGLKPLRFSYVQPRLRPDAEPVRYLDLFCSAEGADAIPAELIAAHLKTFMAISVFKGRDPSTDPDFTAMMQALVPGTKISFVDDADPGQKDIARQAFAARKIIDQ